MSAPTASVVRLEGEYEYDNGDAYRVWVFEVDRPDIPTTRLNMGAMHILTGDKLVQDEDEDRPFRIKRNGRTIATKEWWQIEDLFPAGLPRWKGEEPDAAHATEGVGLLASASFEFQGKKYEGRMVLEDTGDFPKGTAIVRWHDGRSVYLTPGGEPRYVESEKVVDDLERWHQNRVDPQRRAALSLIVPGDKYRCTAELAVEAIPGTPIEAGDLVFLRTSNKWPLPAVHGRLVPLSLEHHERVREHFQQRAGRYAWNRHTKVYDARKAGEVLPIVNVSPRGFWTHHGVVAHYIADRRKWGARRKPWVSDLWVVKRVTPEQVVPITAGSSDAALFELLAQVGGRMPAAGGR